MGALDDHNYQHTFGNTLKPPSSVVGVSAQQAIDAQARRVESSVPESTTGTVAPNSRAYIIFALGSGGISVGLALVAAAVGGIGAVALGLVAVLAGLFTILFAVLAGIEAAKAFVARRR